MATLEDLYKKVMSDREVMGEFVKAASTNTLPEFAQSYGCTATTDEIREHFIAQCEGEIPDDELENVAGGVDIFQFFSDVFNGIITSLGSFFGGGSSPASSPASAPAATTGGSTVSGSSSVVGGGSVKFGSTASSGPIVGKGTVSTLGTVQTGSIYKKL